MFSTFGSRSLRGHTFSVPHSPTGITGARVMSARRAAPHRPFSTGSKNAWPRGIVPCGMIATSSPASSAAAAAFNGSSEPGAPLDADATHRLRDLTDDGASKTSFLPRKRTGRPALREQHRHRGVEVAAVVADDDRRTAFGMCSTPSMSNRAYGTSSGRANAKATCCGSMPRNFGTPAARRGAAPASAAPTRRSRSRGSGFTATG